MDFVNGGFVNHGLCKRRISKSWTLLNVDL